MSGTPVVSPTLPLQSVRRVRAVRLTLTLKPNFPCIDEFPILMFSTTMGSLLLEHGLCYQALIGCASTIFVAIRHYEHYFHLVYVVVQFYPWFKFYFLLFQTHYHTSYPYTITKESKIEPRRKIEPQHVRKQGIVFFARSDWLLKLAICSAIHLRATPNVSYVRNGFPVCCRNY